mgnify:CR=1 FL=1
MPEGQGGDLVPTLCVGMPLRTLLRPLTHRRTLRHIPANTRRGGSDCLVASPSLPLSGNTPVSAITPTRPLCASINAASTSNQRHGGGLGVESPSIG